MEPNNPSNESTFSIGGNMEIDVTTHWTYKEPGIGFSFALGEKNHNHIFGIRLHIVAVEVHIELFRVY